VRFETVTSMSMRSRSREIALQALYQLDQPAAPDLDQVRGFIIRRAPTDEQAEFAVALVEGACEHRARVDQLLTDAAENWALDRMPAVDRNILRLGAFEMLLYPDTPPKVAIDEAIELAKRFSTSQSGAFVNGVLDKLLRADGDGEVIRDP
jgi:transcription antitermination protein NusB